MVRPEVTVKLTADDTELNDELKDAEKKISGFSVKGIAGLAGLTFGFHEMIQAVNTTISKLNEFEQVYLKSLGPDAQTAVKDMGEAIKALKVDVGELWYLFKEPWYKEFTRWLETMKASEGQMEANKEAASAYGEASVVAAKESRHFWVSALHTITGGLLDFNKEIAESARLHNELAESRERLAKDTGLTGLSKLAGRVGTPEDFQARGEAELEKRAEATRQRMIAHERALRTAEDRRIARQRAIGKAQEAAWRKAWEDRQKKMKDYYDKLNAEQKKQLEAGKEDSERVKEARQALKDYRNRDEGFYATMAGGSEMHNRIQVAAASRPAKDTTEQRLKERYEQAKTQYEEGKRRFAQRQTVLEEIRDRMGPARFGGEGK